MNTGKTQGKFNKIYSLFLFSSFLISAFFGAASAQETGVSAPRISSAVDKKAERSKTTAKNESYVYNSCEEMSPGESGVSEKSIAVNEKVAITLRVGEGEVKINGWNRSEIRAFVRNGSGVGFSVLEKSKIDKKPVWVKVLGYDPAKESEFRREESISGKVIELDVPFGATVKIRSGESETTIDSIAKAVVENVGGDIFINNIPQGVQAKTYRGNVTVKNSGGSMMLETTNGNIIAYEAASEESGDYFRARTNSGAITLQQVKYRETEVNTSSGSISFVGDVLNGGQYYFGSQSGLVTLVVPDSSSAKIVAFYGYGNFESEIPLKDIKRDEISRLGSLTGTIGKGEALLNFKTVGGKIFIKKQ